MSDQPPPSAAPPNARARRRTPWWFRLLRFLLNLALLALLGLQLFVLIIFSTEKHLRLPGFLQHAIERHLADEGLSVRFRDLEVTLSGNLLLQGPQVFLAGATEPVAEAKFLDIAPDWFALAWNHRLAFSNARVDGVSFYCPAEVSPSGEREPIITQMDIALSNQGNLWWDLPYLHAHFFNVGITGHGTFLIPLPKAAAPPIPSLAALYRQWAQKLAALQPDFAAVKNPLIQFDIKGAEPGLNKLQVSALAEGAQPPEVAGLGLGRARARASLIWDGEVLRAEGPVEAWLESIRYAQTASDRTEHEIFSGGPLWARVQLADGPRGLLDDWPTRVRLSAGATKIYDFDCDTISADTDLRAWPGLPLTGAVTRGANWLKFTAQTNLDQHTGHLDFSTRVDPAVVLAATHQTLPEELNTLKFDQTPRLEGHVVFAPNYQPEYLDFTLHSEGAHFDRFNLYAARTQGRLTFDPGGDAHELRPASIDLREIDLWNDHWHATGSYFQDFLTADFCLLARGSVDPDVLTPYIKGGWWPKVWQFVVLGARAPEAEVEYSGNWKNYPSENSLFGYVQIFGATVHDVPMDEIRLRVIERPEVVAVFDLAAQAAAGGQITGTMLWMMQPPYRNIYEQRYILNSTLPLADAAKIAGPHIVDLVQPLDSPAAPFIHLDQRTGGSTNPQSDVVVTQVHAQILTPFHAYQVPFDSMDTDFTLYDGFSDISRLDFGIANGTAHAQATLTRRSETDNELDFRLTLQNARQSAFFNAIGQFKPVYARNSTANQSAPSAQISPAPAPPAPPASSTTAALTDPAKPGYLDLSLGGRSLLGQPDSLVAAGQFRIYQAEFGQVHVFGGLSRVLEATGISFSNANLTAAEGDLQIAHQYLYFPDLTLTGESSHMRAAGIYQFGDGQLNFNARLFPFGTIGNPVANTFNLALHGVVAAPQWSVSGWNLFNLVRDQKVDSVPIPDYPADKDGNPVLPAIPLAPPLPPAPEPVKKP